ncbi:hypothetical protein [uncultured Sphingomonas sp.]|uniref:hypothetical protein n=1 Tax=uncultured Sphingomonas sp. TaxID=158754 RepID=UPI0025D8CCE4|nr:hypothetical protein [uncultured Sphingomonas sp.]
MKLFGLGAVWAIYALVVSLGLPQVIYRFPNWEASIHSSDSRGNSPTALARQQAYRQATDQCVGWTSNYYISDGEHGATYGVRCSTLLPATLIVIFTALLVFMPLGALLIYLKRAAQKHA